MYRKNSKIGMKNFIILTTPRTGSTWLGTLLDGHSDIVTYGELFLPYDVPEKYQDLRRNDPEKYFRFKKEHRYIHPLKTWHYLDSVFNHHVDKNSGFKLMAWPLIKNPMMALYILKRKIPIIYLKRDIKDRVLSYEIAAQKDSFHDLKTEKTPLNAEKVTLSPSKVKKRLLRERFFDFYLNLLTKIAKKHCVCIDYSDLEQNTDQKMAEIYSFLGLTPQSAESIIQKSSVSSFEESIENFAEINQLFK